MEKIKQIKNNYKGFIAKLILKEDGKCEWAIQNYNVSELEVIAGLELMLQAKINYIMGNSNTIHQIK